MATINTLQKSIASSIKMIAKYEKGVAMYTERIAKNIVKFNKMYNLELNEDNYKSLLCDIDFGAYCTLSSNLEYKSDNERRLKNEKIRLEHLQNELLILQSEQSKKEQERAKLLSLFKEKLECVKEQWLNQMEVWGNKHYDYIHSKVGEAMSIVKRHSELEYISHQIFGWYSRRPYNEEQEAKWQPYEEEWNTLSRKLQNAKRIISDVANRYNSKKEYINFLIEDCNQLWERDLVKLADDCKHFNVNEDAVECSNAIPTERGFEIIVTDEKPREIYARIIWCAEDSIFVSPHSRYIVTERKR